MPILASLLHGFFPFSTLLSTCQYKGEPDRPSAPSGSLLLQTRARLRLGRRRQAERHNSWPGGPSPEHVPWCWPSEGCSAAKSGCRGPGPAADRAPHSQHRVKQPHAPNCPNGPLARPGQEKEAAEY